MAPVEDEIYILKRDEIESRRLNDQHRLILKMCYGNLVEPSIPIQEIRSVADVATGTGIWLEDLAADLSKTKSALPELVGFDLSAEQYPAKVPHGIELYVQDMMQPFPAKYHNYFDFVHVRLVILAVPEAKIMALTRNLITILKPGGYLQWDDFNFTSKHDELFPSERLKGISDICLDFARKSGISLQFSENVCNAMRECGLKEVKAKDYLTSEQPEMSQASQEWYVKSFSAMLPAIFLKNGQAKDMEQANKLKDEQIADLRDIYASGVVPHMLIVAITAKKPLV